MAGISGRIANRESWVEAISSSTIFLTSPVSTPLMIFPAVLFTMEPMPGTLAGPRNRTPSFAQPSGAWRLRPEKPTLFNSSGSPMMRARKINNSSSELRSSSRLLTVGTTCCVMGLFGCAPSLLTTPRRGFPTIHRLWDQSTLARRSRFAEQTDTR